MLDQDWNVTKGGTPIWPGDVITDFRGQEWNYVGLSREPGFGSTGRVTVTDEFGQRREFFPSVFDLSVSPKGQQ